MASPASPSADLHGPVRRVELRRPGGFVSINEYDREGRLLRSNWTNPDGSAYGLEHRYDLAGRPISIETETGDERWVSTRFVYNDGGNLLRTEYFDKDGQSVQPIETRRVAGGGRIEVVTLNPKELERRGIAYDVNTAIPGARTRTTEYNANDRKTAIRFHDAEHRLLSSTVYEYDANGRLTEEIQTWGDVNPLDHVLGDRLPPETAEALASVLGPGARGHRITYRYDEAGREIERRIDHGLLGETVTRTEYNEQGDIRRTITESQRRDSVTIIEFEYDYDAHGNWTRQTARTLSEPGGEPVHENIETRVIEYYER